MRNGGYFEYKPMFISELPVPKISNKTLEENIALCIEACNETEIDNAIYSLYNLSEEEICYIEQRN